MTLIKTIPEVIQFVRVNFANSESSLPNMERAERKYLVPVLGQAFYDEVVTKYNGQDASEPFKKVLPYIQAALAPLAYYLELPLINTQITDIGLQKTGTGQMQPVFKHDFYKVLQALLDQGMDALEELLAFLEENKTDYPAWASSDAYKDFRRFLIRTGQDYSSIYPLLHPRRCYLMLRPIMDIVQEKYVAASIGAAFFAELLAKDAPSDMEVAVITVLKKAIAYLTIHHATGSLAVRITEAGFTVQAADSELADPNRVAADAQNMRWAAEAAEKTGFTFLVAARKFLNDNATASVFATYFNSPYYQNPAIVKEPLNSQLKSSFVL